MAEVFSDPQVRHLGLAAAVEHPVLGSIDLVRNAVTMDAIPTVRTPAPDAGEHTTEVLAELGYDTEQVAELRARGAF
jgi:crotonobetainyl-CoA:carnitine CoA-transferase CaiB-like acyl-CoA transferase